MKKQATKLITKQNFFEKIFNILYDCFYINLWISNYKSKIIIEIPNIEKKHINNDYEKLLKEDNLYNKINSMYIIYFNKQTEKYFKDYKIINNNNLQLAINQEINETFTDIFSKLYILYNIRNYMFEIVDTLYEEFPTQTTKVKEECIHLLNYIFLLDQKSFMTYFEIIKKIIEESTYLIVINDAMTSSLKEIIEESIFEEYNLNKNKVKNKNIILYQKEKINVEYCNTISQYLTKIDLNKKNHFSSMKKSQPKVIYYRGTQFNYDLSASLYRNNKDPKLEHIINNRIIQNMPNSFKDCETFFDKLTILKHFNCPSRLLDITENPLIAAFFSLDDYYSDENSDFGTIYCCFPKDFDRIKNSKNSDSVSLLSALSTTNKALFISQKGIINITNKIQNFLNDKEIMLNTDKNKKFETETLNRYIKILIEKITFFINTSKINFRNQKILKQAINYLKKILITDNKTLFTREEKNNILYLLRRINNIINETHFFFTELQHQAELINPSFKYITPEDKDINSYYIVHPSLNNQRIVNQQGLFVLIGANKDNNQNYYRTNSTYLDLFENNSYKRVLFIINNKNGKFYNDLNRIHGINKSFVYPELEKKINQIKQNIYTEYEEYEATKIDN